MFVQIVVNTQATWPRDVKDRLATSMTDAVRSVLADETGEVSIWFEEFGPLDVFVGADPVASSQPEEG